MLPWVTKGRVNILGQGVDYLESISLVNTPKMGRDLFPPIQRCRRACRYINSRLSHSCLTFHLLLSSSPGPYRCCSFSLKPWPRTWLCCGAPALLPAGGWWSRWRRRTFRATIAKYSPSRKGSTSPNRWWTWTPGVRWVYSSNAIIFLEYTDM